MFPIGTKVVLTADCYPSWGLPPGSVGTVLSRPEYPGSVLAVKFDGLTVGHACGGLCLYGTGLWVYEYQLSLAKPLSPLQQEAADYCRRELCR